MTKRIEVESVIIQDAKVLLSIDSNEIAHIEGAEPSGRILSDSDKLSFIYILESHDEFIYISIKHNNWHHLKEGLDLSIPFVLQYGEKHMVLHLFAEELEQLIINIEGNANYGTEMVKEVEKIFHVNNN
jgi:hypothetical protein